MAADAAASWLKIVDEDLRQVVNNLQGPLPSPAGAAYHCQQAAEKLVKAALVKAGLAFPSFEKLTPFGVAYRYPAKDEWEIPSAEAIETWRKEIETVRSMF